MLFKSNWLIRELFKRKFLECRSLKQNKLTLFITDHGDKDTGIVLWNNKRYSVEKLKTQLEKLPKKATVQIVTEMCRGGQLFRLTSDNVCVVANSDDQTIVESDDSDKSRFAIGFTDAIRKNTKTSFIDAFVAGKKNDEKNFVHLTSVDYFVNTTENPSAIKCDNKENCQTWTQNFKGLQSSVILADIDDYLSKTDKKNDSKYEKYFRQKLEQIKKDLKISKNEHMDIMLARAKKIETAFQNNMKRIELIIRCFNRKKAIQECYDSCYTHVNQALSSSGTCVENNQKADQNRLNSLKAEQKATIAELKFLRKEKDEQKLFQYRKIRGCVEHEI